jgi:predicted nucleic acid-binding protein
VGEIVYLDVCCFKRAFDDQRSTRVQLETAAIAALISCAEREQIRLVRSPAHVFENDRNPREDRRLATSAWLEAARVETQFTEQAAARGRELADLGFGALDALHLAFAETSGARWLATTDDRFAALGQRHSAALVSEIANPIRVLDLLKENPL